MRVTMNCYPERNGGSVMILPRWRGSGSSVKGDLFESHSVPHGQGDQRAKYHDGGWGALVAVTIRDSSALSYLPLVRWSSLGANGGSSTRS